MVPRIEVECDFVADASIEVVRVVRQSAIEGDNDGVNYGRSRGGRGRS